MTKKETSISEIEPIKQPDRNRTLEPKIYIGPNLKGVLSGTVFKNGYVPSLEEAIVKVPAIAELIIPVSQLVNVKKELQDPGSALSQFYHLAENYRKGVE